MKKIYKTPKIRVLDCTEEDVLTFSAGTLFKGEIEISDQWWKTNNGNFS